MRIKICCIRSADEAKLAIQLGAHALGLVGVMPSNNGVIDDESIREITATIPPTYMSVLLTSRIDAQSVVDHLRETGANAIQLVGAIDPDGVGRVREALPGIQLIKVIHVENERTIQTAADYEPLVDALLLDTKVKSASGVALGGTGKTHDWTISRRIVAASTVPVFLAGGLTVENVAEAVRTVQPFGVDICSGLRPNRSLDPARMRQFVANANLA